MALLSLSPDDDDDFGVNVDVDDDAGVDEDVDDDVGINVHVVGDDDDVEDHLALPSLPPTISLIYQGHWH